MKIPEIAETILLEKFRTEPFHNFQRLKEAAKFSSCIGGTCSDKTKSYLNALNKKDIKASLHTATIENKFNHHLVRIEFEGHAYFADVGNGWPSIYLYPDYKAVNYNCYGMNFRSEIHEDTIKIFHTRLNTEKLQMEFNRKPQDQKSVKMNIKNRFADSIVYPFDKGLRFSMIVANRFLFIRNHELQIYSKNDYKIIDGISMNNLQDILRQYFSFSL